MSRQINEGLYVVSVTCPHCDQETLIEAQIDGVLKVRAGRSTLSVACTGKTVEHLCGQGTIGDPELAGQVLEFLEDEGAVQPGLLKVDTDTGEIVHSQPAERGVRL